MDKNNITSVKIPAGAFCGHNCSDGCIYWNPYDRDSNGRQYCSHYDALILSILVDTFISKISFPMQPGPEIGSISDA